MGTLLDLLLLLVISKEALQVGNRLPLALWVAFVLALPFLLGMGHSLREDTTSVVLNPVRVLIGQGITMITVILFVTMLSYQGLAPAFWALFLATLLPYAMGRFLGMTLKSLLALGVIVVMIFFVVRFLGLV